MITKTIYCFGLLLKTTRQNWFTRVQERSYFSTVHKRPNWGYLGWKFMIPDTHNYLMELPPSTIIEDKEVNMKFDGNSFSTAR